MPRAAGAAERELPRLGLPSKGRMAEDTLALLKTSQMGVRKLNPRQYAAEIPALPGLEVWFQRATDCVRKLSYGDIDIAIVGYDMFREVAADNDDLIVVHDALKFGKCHLALAVPKEGRWAQVTSYEDLVGLGWTAEEPLRVVTGYPNLADEFFKERGFEHFEVLSADGALEAAPAMGCADIILDLVSTGTTLRENNLREIVGGNVLESEGVLVASRRALKERPDLMNIVKEMIERVEAHLQAEQFFTVICNVRGDSQGQVAEAMIEAGLGGLEGPTVAPVFRGTGVNSSPTFAVTICVRKKALSGVIKELRSLGGSGVLVTPITYIFEDEPWRWRDLLQRLED